jgi:hypothetical protein
MQLPEGGPDDSSPSQISYKQFKFSKQNKEPADELGADDQLSERDYYDDEEGEEEEDGEEEICSGTEELVDEHTPDHFSAKSIDMISCKPTPNASSPAYAD